MAGVHLKPGSDTPMRCNARKPENCPFTPMGAIHFKNNDDAYAYIAKEAKREYEHLKTLNRNKKETTTKSVDREFKSYDEQLELNHLRHRNPFYNESIDLDILQEEIHELKDELNNNSQHMSDKEKEHIQKRIDLRERIMEGKNPYGDDNYRLKIEENEGGTRAIVPNPRRNEIRYTYGSTVEFEIPAHTIRVKDKRGKTKIVKQPAEIAKARIISPTPEQSSLRFRGDTIEIMYLDSGEKEDILLDEHGITVESDRHEHYYGFKVIKPMPWDKNINETNRKIKEKFYKNFKAGDRISLTSNYDFEESKINGTYTIISMQDDETNMGDTEPSSAEHITVMNDKTGEFLYIDSNTELNPRGRFLITKAENNGNEITSKNSSSSSFSIHQYSEEEKEQIWAAADAGKIPYAYAPKPMSRGGGFIRPGSIEEEESQRKESEELRNRAAEIMRKRKEKSSNINIT